MMPGLARNRAPFLLAEGRKAKGACSIEFNACSIPRVGSY
jgi:hypothetical protein